jgi:hypothetical protein
MSPRVENDALQQGFAIREMGFQGRAARKQLCADVDYLVGAS